MDQSAASAYLSAMCVMLSRRTMARVSLFMACLLRRSGRGSQVGRARSAQRVGGGAGGLVAQVVGRTRLARGRGRDPDARHAVALLVLVEVVLQDVATDDDEDAVLGGLHALVALVDAGHGVFLSSVLLERDLLAEPVAAGRDLAVLDDLRVDPVDLDGQAQHG